MYKNYARIEKYI